MEDEAEAVEEASAPSDVLALMLSTLANLDPTAMVTNFIGVVEWIEEDGSPTLSVLGTAMPPWHISGLLQHVMDDLQNQVAVHSYMVDQSVEDDDDEDF